MIDISVCMVSLNCWNVIQDCLDSLAASEGITTEVIIVDNGSTDGSAEKIAKHYPYVKLIRNTGNTGFTKGTNQAIEVSTGRYILWLNTDTILKPDSLRILMEFLEQHPDAGIVGPKVLNPDGTFQPQCKRGMPTPEASLSYMLKLHKVFPQNRVAGQYLLTYLPEDEAAQVDAVSGCCLLARREVWDKIGSLDEAIFAFGEDIDWCVRAKNAGFQIWYYPKSSIVHLKGKGGVHSQPYKKAKGMHDGMWIFYHKHLESGYPQPVSWLVKAGIQTSYVLTCSSIWLRRKFSG